MRRRTRVRRCAPPLSRRSQQPAQQPATLPLLPPKPQRQPPVSSLGSSRPPDFPFLPPSRFASLSRSRARKASPSACADPPACQAPGRCKATRSAR
eukprot:364503-Chlamydomonas_euryale.AAC.6